MFVPRPFLHNFAQIDLFEDSVFLHRKRQRTVLIPEIRLSGRVDSEIRFGGRVDDIRLSGRVDPAIRLRGRVDVDIP